MVPAASATITRSALTIGVDSIASSALNSQPTVSSSGNWVAVAPEAAASPRGKFQSPALLRGGDPARHSAVAKTTHPVSQIVGRRRRNVSMPSRPGRKVIQCIIEYRVRWELRIASKSSKRQPKNGKLPRLACPVVINLRNLEHPCSLDCVASIIRRRRVAHPSPAPPPP